MKCLKENVKPKPQKHGRVVLLADETGTQMFGSVVTLIFQ